MTAISVRNLSRIYPAGDGLKPTSLEVGAGEFCVLLGPSGSGKTTLLRLLSGFEKPDSGAITIDDKDVTRLEPEARPTAMVFQSHALWPHMSVFDNVAFGLRVRGESRSAIAQKVAETLELVQLGHLAGRKPGALSGGQRQRVALARALAVEPRVLLLDEPLSALDARLRDDLRLELRAIQERLRLTAVYVTHDQDDALALADRVAVLRDGVVLQHGTPEDIYERPASSFVARFCGDSVLLPCETVSREPDGALRCRLPSGESLIAAAGKEHADFLSIRPQAIELAGTHSENTLRAQVVHRRYAGGSYALVLRTAAGVDLTIESNDPGLTPGSSVGVRLPAERLWGILDDPSTEPSRPVASGEGAS